MNNRMGFCKICNALCRDVSFTSYCKMSQVTNANKKNIKQKPYTKIFHRLGKCIASGEEVQYITNAIPTHFLREAATTKFCYLVSRTVASDIVPLIGNGLSSSPLVIEVNPGLGFITQKLLQNYVERIKVYESSKDFETVFNKLNQNYLDRIEQQHGDFFGLARALHLDSYQNTSGYEETLVGIKRTRWENDFCATVVGVMPSLNFIFHYIKCIIFNSHLASLGRINLYLVMPPHNYKFITDTNLSKRFVRMSSLFNLLFDHELIAKVNKGAFVPWIKDNKKDEDDTGLFYVVNVKPKSKLPCNVEHLPLLRHFLSPQYVRNSLCVIPTIEQLIPHSGIWIITGQDPPGSNSDTLPNESDEPLPKINVFTRFEELSLKQKVTIFKRLISWPEFDQCHLNASLESTFTASNDAVDIKETSFENISGADDEEISRDVDI